MNTTKLPSQEELHKLFTYKDGELYWKVKHNGRCKTDTPAGGLAGKGYKGIRIKGHRYATHRLIWKYIKGVEPVGVLDHINRDITDNRIENLRDVAQTTNMLNTRAKGVSKVKPTGRYRAQVTINDKFINLGCFDTEVEASSRYREFKELCMEMVNA